METVRVGGRKYSDPDVISLIRATGELVDPRSAVVNQARKLNCEYRSYDGGQASPMKRLEIIASLCGLTISPMNIERRRAEREANELERLCDLAASELLMPLE